jgi:hypothetical protein
MTYEEKLLQVFARYAGQQITSQTLVEMEKACEKEVWVHLPKPVRDAWALHLEFSETRPGQIDLSPRPIGSPTVDLESALKAPFVDRTPPPMGGIASFSLGFSDRTAHSSDPSATKASAGTPQPASSSQGAVVARGEIRGVPAEPSRAEPVVEAVVARGDFAAHPAQQQSTTQVGEQVTAQGIAASAKELGIALPPNSSLLGPFLEAVELAITYKRRAEAAEAALAQR